MTEPVTEPDDGVVRERVVERGGTTIVERKSGAGGVLIGIAVLALVVIVGFFLLQYSRNDAVRTDAVTSAASSVADSASSAAEGVSNAAGRAADAVTPE